MTPSWETVYTDFRKWRRAGSWERWNSALREAVRLKANRKRQPSAAILDSQSVKTVEGGAERGYDAGKKVTGRNRHLGVDTLGLVLLGLVTAAHVQDRDGARLVLQALFARLKHSKSSRGCRLSKDYERLSATSEACVYVAMIRLMVKRLAH